MTPTELRKLADDLARGVMPMGAAYAALRNAAEQIESLELRLQTRDGAPAAKTETPPPSKQQGKLDGF